jgi:hypothetical protein
MLKPPTIVVNNILYVFCEKSRCLENKKLLKTTPLSYMIVGCLKKKFNVLKIEF